VARRGIEKFAQPIHGAQLRVRLVYTICKTKKGPGKPGPFNKLLNQPQWAYFFAIFSIQAPASAPSVKQEAASAAASASSQLALPQPIVANAKAAAIPSPKIVFMLISVRCFPSVPRAGKLYQKNGKTSKPKL
jgi:hypothetical protein